MEFNFQKKTPNFVLGEPMSSRPRNIKEVIGMAPTSDFHHQSNINPQVLISNPHMDSSHFNSLVDFQPQHNSSQIPQFIFEQEGCPTNEENFLSAQKVTSRKDESDKHSGFFQRKIYSNMGHCFDTLSNEGSPQRILQSPSNDFQFSARSGQHPFQFENKLPAVDKQNHQPQMTQVSEPSQVAPSTSERPPQNVKGQNCKTSVSNPVQNTNMLCSDTMKASEKSKSCYSFDKDLHDFSKSYDKLLSEKVELEKQVACSDLSLKECKDKLLYFESKYKEVKEKLSEEVKNREAVLSQVEYVANMSQSLDKQFKDVGGRLKFYEDLNAEYKDRHSKLEERAEKGIREYDSVLSNYKSTTEKLRSQVLQMEKKLHESSSEFLKIKDSLTLQIDEVNKKLCSEQNKSTTFHNQLLVSEQIKEEMALKNEQLENTFSEKYTSLENLHEDTKKKIEALQKDYAELKIYEIKYKELETFIDKVQEEKEGMSKILDASQQNLLKSETERSENIKRIERLYNEKEKANEMISKLKNECVEINLKLKDESACRIKLFNENEEMSVRFQNMCEDMAILKKNNVDMEDKIKKTNTEVAMYENTVKELKEQLDDVQEALLFAKEEIRNKSENVQSLREQLSSAVLLNEQHMKTEEELRQIITEKEKTVIELEASKLLFEEQMEKVQEELAHTKKEMINSRQEMLASVDQYREQYMNELKETEEKTREIHNKYEATREELEKILEQKKESDEEIRKLQKSIKVLEKKALEKENTIKELKHEVEKEQKFSKQKENEYNENYAKLKSTVTQLQEERQSLTSAMQDMKVTSHSDDGNQEKINSLENQIKIVQKENMDLREKIKTAEDASLRKISTSQDTVLKFPGELPLPRKRVCFDDESMSDASSIDIATFFNRNEVNSSPFASKSFKPGTETATKSKTEYFQNRPTPRKPRNVNQSKKFFRKGTEDINIFGRK